MGKIAWGITGGGHLLSECVEQLKKCEDADIFLSEAGREVLDIYSVKLPFVPLKDRSASGVTCRAFASGVYDVFVVAPATSNSVAKFVCGISDSLITTLFAQCGKSRVPIIVLPTDLEESVDTMGATKPLKIYPRPIDLKNIEELRKFPGVTVVETVEALESAIFRIRQG